MQKLLTFDCVVSSVDDEKVSFDVGDISKESHPHRK